MAPNTLRIPCISAFIVTFLVFVGPVLAGHGGEGWLSWVSSMLGRGVTLDTDENGLAIRGYDSVAYFTEGKATRGIDEHQNTWLDATWYFSSARNRALFVANPEKYAPQYGAFCALGVSVHQAVSVDPEAWTIVNGKLYLNYTLEYRDKWQQNKLQNIAKADAVWSEHKIPE